MRQHKRRKPCDLHLADASRYASSSITMHRCTFFQRLLLDTGALYHVILHREWYCTYSFITLDCTEIDASDFQVFPAYCCDGAVYVTTLPCTHIETCTVSFHDAISHFDDTLLPFRDVQKNPSLQMSVETHLEQVDSMDAQIWLIR